MADEWICMLRFLFVRAGYTAVIRHPLSYLDSYPIPIWKTERYYTSRDTLVSIDNYHISKAHMSTNIDSKRSITVKQFQMLLKFVPLDICEKNE